MRALAERDAAAWQEAVVHPFLDGAREETLPSASFDRWLEQDRHFIERLARVWARVLTDAPEHDIALLADGISSFAAEVTWLRERIAERGLDPARPELPATAAYLGWLDGVAAQPYPVALAALWAVEGAYLDAWRSARPGAGEYRPFVEHWSGDAFAEFVDRLAASADTALGERPEHVDAAAAAIATTARHESAFWAMTWTG